MGDVETDKRTCRARNLRGLFKLSTHGMKKSDVRQHSEKVEVLQEERGVGLTREDRIQYGAVAAVAGTRRDRRIFLSPQDHALTGTQAKVIQR